MAPKTAERPIVNDDLDDFGVDDFNPLVNSGDEQQQSKKRDAAGLGIDEAVAVTKKQRRPNVKLDEDRLLSDKGLPRLRKKAAELKFKGKGHEFSDAARLLSFYQLWLDDLFPKAKFLDALAMVEKCGHKNRVRMKRLEIIDEGKPKPIKRFGDDDEEEDGVEGRGPTKFPARVAPIFQNNSADGRQRTPAADSLFGDDEDIYNATPKRLRPDASVDVPPADEAENQARNGEPDEDELDALMAEEEAQRTVPTSLFGNGNIAQKSASRPPDAEDDLDALIAEAEADTGSTNRAAASHVASSVPAARQEEDELDAFMAETESQGRAPEARKELQSKGNETRPDNSKDVDADEEEAMSEMDGLW